MTLVELAEELGFPDLVESQINAWRGDLRDALAARDMCSRCKSLSGCPWSGVYPMAGLEQNGLLEELVVRYVRCGVSGAAAAESARRERWASCGIPERYREASLENYQTQGLHEDCRKLKAEILAALRDGHSLILASAIKGNGKTHLACAFARERLEAGKSARFWVVKELLDAAKAGFDGAGPDPFELAKRVDVLVLDDLGAQFTRDWGFSELYGLINHRYNHELQTLVTTNIANPRDLATAMGEQGERIVSRLKEMAFWVVSAAPDFRSRRRQQRLVA